MIRSTLSFCALFGALILGSKLLQQSSRSEPPAVPTTLGESGERTPKIDGPPEVAQPAKVSHAPLGEIHFVAYDEDLTEKVRDPDDNDLPPRPTRELEDLLRDEATADPTVALERGEQAAALAGLLESLSPRERQVIDWRFGLSGGDEPSTLGEIGARLGLSRERVRQIEAAALMRLRASATGSCPSDPFDDAA